MINSRKNVPLGKDYAKKYCCLPNHIHIHRDKREKEQKGLKFTKTSSRIPHKINSVNQRKHILVIVIDFLSVVISNVTFTCLTLIVVTENNKSSPKHPISEC